ncbi:MAG: molecular chaperone HtpG [Christensenellaceae bacterium]|nr:molecular chaperone HtpG [Christensenellaceae bacterium]
MNEKGSVSIDAQNMMPVIKRWLYSDKDIFLREVVSNGCDAITKYRMLNPGTEEAMSVTVTVDKEKKELRISDTGIGMTADEVKRYINQVAFSGASEFMKNVGDDQEKGDIIGHFGLGFYSVFMVSESVEIETLSCSEGAEPVHWRSVDGMDFEISAGSRDTHGTTIILHVSEEEQEFLEMYRVREVLGRYCGYMASPVFIEDANAKPIERDEEIEGETNEDGTPKTRKVLEEPKPSQINDTDPLWLKKPSDCEDQQYIDFYHKMFGWEEPLFWIHLNVDYPFNLKGILYFPRLKNDFGTREGQVKLFSGQVFVADNVKEVIPEFLMLLKGVIDCPDLPLNVSRSFLQNDGTVKKLSAHITKKVADKLTSLFNTARETYEGYWDDIAPFVKFGCIRDQKFYDQVKKALLYKTTDDKYLTLDEYRARNGEKAAKKVYYTNDPKRQAASVALYTQRGMDVIVMDHLIDGNFQSFMEYSGGEEELSFARVDADVSGLTEESDEGKELDQEALQTLFRKALNQEELTVQLAALADADLPAMVTEDEQMRRMKEMSRIYGQSFAFPDRYTLVLNRKNATVAALAARDPEDETTVLLCQQVYDLARMAAQPLESDEITAFLARSQKLLSMIVS